jgi:hypothetical protein
MAKDYHYHEKDWDGQYRGGPLWCVRQLDPYTLFGDILGKR